MARVDLHGDAAGSTSLADPETTVAVRTRTATRVAPVAHAVMSAAMAAMFLGVV